MPWQFTPPRPAGTPPLKREGSISYHCSLTAPKLPSLLRGGEGVG